MNNVHFAIPEIYGETLSYYELLRKLVDKTNDLIDNYNTVPEQIAEAVANLDASQLFSAVLNQLIHSIATDNTKSANAVKVYKKHDLLYATFNETVNLYESMIDFTPGTETELIVGTNIREVNISELFIELRKLIDINKNNIEAVTAVANENSAEITTIHNDITSIENKNTEQDNEISTLRTMISTPYNFKGEVASISALPSSGEVNDTYYVQAAKYKVTWTGSAWVQSSLSEADYQTELSELKSDLVDIVGDIKRVDATVLSTETGDVPIVIYSDISAHKIQFDLDILEGQLMVYYKLNGEFKYVALTKTLILESESSEITYLQIYRQSSFTSKDCVIKGKIKFDAGGKYEDWRNITDESISNLNESVQYLESKDIERFGKKYEETVSLKVNLDANITYDMEIKSGEQYKIHFNFGDTASRSGVVYYYTKNPTNYTVCCDIKDSNIDKDIYIKPTSNYDGIMFHANQSSNPTTTMTASIEFFGTMNGKSNKFITVGKDGDFENIQSAIDACNDSVTNPVVILIKPGVYEPFSMTDKERRLHYISLIGLDRANTKVINTRANYYYPSAEIWTTGTIENIQFITNCTEPYDETETAYRKVYAVHSDFGNYGYTIYKNCYFYSNGGSAIGIGLHQDETLEFHDCTFVMNADGTHGTDAGGAFFTHTALGPNNTNQKLLLNNCLIVNERDGNALQIDESSQYGYDTTGSTNEVTIRNTCAYANGTPKATIGELITKKYFFGNNF